MKKLLQSLFILMFVAGAAMAQDRTVTGTVTGKDDGLPIPGVSVKIGGTANGTSTDANGKYALKVASGQNLISIEFSSIGYLKQLIPLGSSDVVNAALSTDAKQLGEVVVTAFGIQRKTRAIGYTASTLNNSDLAQKSEPDPLRAMSGKVAGVNIIASNGVPGSATNISIRGNTSFLYSNKPLIVVDGIPFDNQSTQSGASTLVNGNAVSNRAVDLDPNNIESMTVIKSAAAAALYGSRAANGVILITTKSGKSGANKKGFEITLSSSYAIEKVASLPDYQNRFGAGSEFNYSNANGSWGPEFGQPNTIRYPQGNGIAADGTIPHWFAGRASLPQFPATARTPFQAYPDNVADFFKTGSVFENAVQVSTGGEKGNFSASASKSKNLGIIENSDFTRTTFNVGGNMKLDNKVTVSGTLSYVESNQAGPILGAQNGVGQASAFARTLYLGRNWNLSDFNVVPFQDPVTLGQLFFVPSVDNPYWSVKNNTYKSDVNRVYGNVGLSYDVNSWLNLNYKIGVNQYTDSRFRTIRRGSVGANGIGEVTYDQISNQEIESTFLATVTKSITPDLNFRGILGHNVNQARNQRESVVGSNMVVFDIDDISNTANVIPNGAQDIKKRLYGIFADLQFDYKSYLFLNVTGRNDWSSTLPKSNRSFFYSGVSGSFVFSELTKDNTPWLSFGKLRLNWAKVGNDAPPYLLNPTYLVNPTFGNNASNITFPFVGFSGGSVGNGLADPNLTPEFTTEREIGAELRFLNDLIGLDFTYYDKKSTDQIAPVTIASSSGFTSKLTNFGEMRNRGIEIGLDLNPFKNPNGFSWNIYGIFSQNRNKVVSLTQGLTELSLIPGFGDPAVVLRPGRPYGIMVGTKAAKDADGNFLINKTTGLLIRKPGEEIGDPNPKFTTALTNTFRYKGLSLSVLIDYKHGGDLYSNTVSQLLGRGVTTDTEDRLTPKIIKGYYGDATTFQPILDGNGNKIPNEIQATTNDLYFNGNGGLTGVSDLLIFDASVFRLREISLGYAIPKKWLGNSPVGSINVSFTARNLFFYAPNFPKGTNFDPETSTYGASDTRNVQGIEYTNAPSTKRYGFNIRATF
ncbi:SusC/RagA family TonB-linked outer membrane protein [Pedobacter hiemivivus]|uniref:SusC/RagA family TonB-linked outer membrane protein n=1 Tax=Pedobacter hiemivivus TaxID=2530454 RepID=A0A4R0N4Y9_9SPHI|nr:SusC/RagA family TonB-linked outer membrane protein [Pedobacter hiemivivus]TCC94960.1 SusC/RagA family TonB-linked outer membrane protein [Pedobacter hiemivivus]